MNPKNKIVLPLLAFACFLAISGHAFADETAIPFTGTAYGEKIGLLHMDYTTAKKPAPPAADPNKFNGSGYYVKGQFFINPYVGNAHNADYWKPTGAGPGDETTVARISTLKSDCTVSGCNLKGFIWSDTIGWIVLDGKMISDAVNESLGLTPDADGIYANDDKFDADGNSLDAYPSTLYPRIKKTGALTGIAWNKDAGWIVLSSNLNQGTNRVPNQQTAVDFGAWLEATALPTFIGTDATTADQIGRPFHGYIWSENLGWIKLGIEPEDSFPFDFKVYTNWTPDDTAPYLTASKLAWFSVGVNTGYDPNEHLPGGTIDNPNYNANPTTVVWRHFAVDPESGVYKKGSEFNISPVPNETDIHCFTPSNTAIAVSNSSDDRFSIDLTIPTIGNLAQTDVGFCKFLLTGKLLNAGSNLPTFIGDTFIKPTDVITDNKVDPIIVYVRAGNPDLKKSLVTPNGITNATILADGKESFKFIVKLNDVAGNPLRDIHCGDPYPSADNDQFQYPGCPNREVTLNAILTNPLTYDLTQTPLGNYPTPIRYSESDVAEVGLPLLKDDTKPEVFWDKGFAKGFAFEVTSYAPSSSFSIATEQDVVRNFYVDKFEYKIENAALPALSKRLTLSTDTPPVASFSDDPSTVVPDYTLDPANTSMVANSLTPTPHIDLTGGNINSVAGFIMPNDPTLFSRPALFFKPAITVSNPILTSGTLQGTLSIGLPANLKFNVYNYSSKAIAKDSDNGGLSIDNLFYYGSESTSYTVAVMETHRISGVSDPETPDEQGWTDPIHGMTRYEMVDGRCYEETACGTPPCDVQEVDCTQGNSPFHSYYQSFHSGKDFCYDLSGSDSCVPPNDINPATGTYAISGAYSIPNVFDPVIDSTGAKTYPYPDKAGKIDRDDLVDFSGLVGTNDPETPTFVTKEIRFTPEKFVPVTIDDIQMKLYDDIAYRFGKQPLFAVYTTDKLNKNYDVMDIGLEAKGTVSGEQIVTGREYETVGTTSTKTLQEQIRRNVAQLTSGVDLSGCAILAGKKTLVDFETSGPCYVHDTVNGTAFVYYSGGPDDIVELGDGLGGILDVPDMPYTIVIKGGANLSIRNNIRYVDTRKKSSLGLILIADQIGKGSNVYISPDPTNIVGTLYAEGSLISRDKDGNDYYGGGAGKIQDLKNQLYWQGNIASRNTIAGAGLKKIPEGVSCLAGDTELECAQRYDLDYLRRFTAVVDSTTLDSTISNDGKFSGGGCCGTVDCTATAGTCKLGDLPTVVKLDGSNKIKKAESKLSTVYIEPSARTASNPPPGFSSVGGQESTQTIR